MPHAAIQRLSQETQECVDNCQECHEICVEAVDHCLRKGGQHAEPDHIRLLQDCAQIFRTAPRSARRPPTSCFAVPPFMGVPAGYARRSASVAPKNAKGWKTT